MDSAALNLALGAVMRGQAWRRSYDVLSWSRQQGLGNDAVTFASSMGLTQGPGAKEAWPEAWPMAICMLRGCDAQRDLSLSGGLRCELPYYAALKALRQALFGLRMP